jgi:hypothetical protein
MLMGKIEKGGLPEKGEDYKLELHTKSFLQVE